MAAAIFSFREHWRELKRGRPGRRFQQRYERARQDDRRRGAGQRIVMFLMAAACLFVGVLLAVLPGPAIPFFFLAGGLLATESRTVARFMDWAEVKLRAVFAWGKRRWRRLPWIGRMIVLLIGAGGSAAGTYLSFRLMQD